MRAPILAAAATAAVVAAVAVPALASVDTDASRKGASWLSRAVKASAGDGQAADSAVAMRAAGALGRVEGHDRAEGLRRGARGYAVTPGAAGKVALGLVAVGATNPGCAGGVDLVRKLTPASNGRFGNTIFDQTLAIIALKALGRPVPAKAVAYLKRIRKGGGWSVIPSQEDDTSSTAMGVLALRAAGKSKNDATIKAALRWIDGQRTSSGGFALGRGDRNESNSTALAAEAYASVGRRDDRALRVLRGLQRSNGSFNFAATDAGNAVIASVDAVVALAGKHIPVATLRSPAGGC